MIQAILGIVTMIIPLSLALIFKDRFRGFLTILAGLITWHLILAIATQALQIFSYNLIISINSLIALTTLITIFTNKNRIERPRFEISYFAIFAVLIIVFQFWSVHYSYSGTITDLNGYREVKNFSYNYPYYSDEWIGVSLINYSIENQALPLVNPLWENTRFNNPTFPFFSFLAEIFLVLQLNPLTTYPILAIIAGTVISLLAYLIIRKLGAGIPAALLATLSIPYIINGANLPGLWYFLPLTAGLVLFLFSLIAFITNEKKLALVYSILAIIFYPPIIVFSLPIIIFVFAKSQNKKTVWLAIGSLILVFLIALTFIFPGNNFSTVKDSILSFIFRTNLQTGIPKFSILTIIPVWTLILALAGFANELKSKKYFLAILILIGLIFWTIYSGTQKVFVIEYQRVIVITSILITILAGLGFESIKSYLKLSEKHLALLILIIFAVASPFYTKHTDWRKLVMQIGTGEEQIKISPASPANIYLTQNDLELFKNIKSQRFIAPPWKGLVIGVATSNYPLESKPSTLTNKILPYNTFLSATCAEKTTLAQKFQIAYTYSTPFTCPALQKLGEGDGSLVLYKFVK